jgi:hypothetical protein
VAESPLCQRAVFNATGDDGGKEIFYSLKAAHYYLVVADAMFEYPELPAPLRAFTWYR